MTNSQSDKKIDFVNLHNHTHYSLLDGLQKIPTMLDQVEAFGQKAIAITDHGTMSGAIEFYKTCKKRGIKPIVGIETYVAPRGHTDRSAQEDRDPYHLTLLAKNYTGYKNLMRLSTIACLDGFYYRPRIDRNLLERYHDGIICLSGCIGGEVPGNIRNGNYEKAMDAAKWHLNLFGKENYFFEIQPYPGWEPQMKVNEGLLKLGKEMGIDVVATSDTHYTYKEDSQPHDILLCVQTGSTLEDENRLKIEQDISLKSGEEVLSAFPDHPEAIHNTVKIAEMCNLEIELGRILIPTFDLPEGKNEKEYLRELVFQGAAWRYGGIAKKDVIGKSEGEIKNILPEEVQKRIEYELDVIGKMEYEGYFLIVADLINWSKDRGIVCGPGRGSAAGSIIAYTTGITELDPIKHGLLFERFLNPDRISMPDIDMDFADDRRNEVIQYAAEKYGEERVAQIITFGIMAARNAVRDTGRVLGMPYAEVDAIAKLIPAPVQGRHIPLSKSVVDDPELKKEYDNNLRAKNLINIAMKLEGTIRNAGIHAAGVVISKDPLVENTPLTRAQKGGIATQYSMGPIEDLGLLKFDFLGLANLTTIKNALRIIRKVHGLELNVSDIPIDDLKTYELLSRGDTTGVFQLESSGMKRYIKELRPSRFEDIVAMVALYRPGPMQWIGDFIQRKHNPQLIKYDHPKMKAALEETYGIIVYQEQVMQISKDLCGFTGGQADTLRKAIGKKQAETLAKMKKDFMEGAIKNSGADAKFVEGLWKSLEDFAAYCFNKSHAACYALIAVQTAYLKAHYPEAFMAALMTSDKGDLDRISVEIDECRSMGITVVAPDINKSFMTFAVVPGEKKITYALSAIKNVGEGPIEIMEEARKKDGPFSSLEDFLKRTASGEVNKKTLESLIRCGALDSFGERNQLLSSIDAMLQYAHDAKLRAESGQIDMFGSIQGGDSANSSLNKIILVDSVPATDKQRLEWEKELLGVYVSGHPLDAYREIITKLFPPMSSIGVAHEGKEIRIGGAISSVHKITTRSKEPMLFVTVEDFSGTMEVIVFPKKLSENPSFWTEGKVVVVTGKVSNKDGQAKILVDKFEEFSKSLVGVYEQELEGKKQEEEGSVTIVLSQSLDSDDLSRMKRILLKHEGPKGVVLSLNASGENKKIKLPFKIRFDDYFKNDLRAALGFEPEFSSGANNEAMANKQ